MTGNVPELIKKELKTTAGNMHKGGDVDCDSMPDLTEGDGDLEDWRRKSWHKQEKGRKDAGCLEHQRCAHATREDSKQADVEWTG